MSENTPPTNPSPVVMPADSSQSPTYRVMLPEFEGPLDLLLHLCQTHEIDILNISVAFVAEKYIEYLEMMEHMAVEVAADYLVMAAHLAYLKSRELVPAPEPLEATEDGDELIDPREELIRRLLEYQKYKHAAENLGSRPIEGRNVFVRGAVLQAEEEAGLAEHSVWKLLEHWASTLKKAKPEHTHDVIVDRVSISDRINQIVDLLEAGHGMVRFDDLLGEDLAPAELRHKVVVSLLAVLELARLKVVRILQQESTGTFFLAQVDGAVLEDARHLQVTSAKETLPSSSQENVEAPAAGDGQAEAPPTTEPEATGGEEARVLPTSAGAPAGDGQAQAQPAESDPMGADGDPTTLSATGETDRASAVDEGSEAATRDTEPRDLETADAKPDEVAQAPHADELDRGAVAVPETAPTEVAAAAPAPSDDRMETTPAEGAATPGESARNEPAARNMSEPVELRPQEEVIFAPSPASAATGEDATDGQTQEEQTPTEE
jgi:segregation and condensation protein A